jgi:hypothetical protein
LPAGGLRLARNQSSLVNILSANLAEQQQGALAGPHAHAPAAQEQAAQEQAERYDAGGAPVENRTPRRGDDVASALGAGEPLGPAQAPPAASPPPPSAPAAAAGESRVWIAAPADRPGGRAQAAASGAPRGTALDAARRAEGASAPPGGEDFTAAAAAQQPGRVPLLPYAPGDAPTPPTGLALPAGAATNSPDLPAAGRAAAALEESAWPAAPDIAAERPLSSAQIEQVLAALDERLELLLLRTYGASANL